MTLAGAKCIFSQLGYVTGTCHVMCTQQGEGNAWVKGRSSANALGTSQKENLGDLICK